MVKTLQSSLLSALPPPPPPSTTTATPTTTRSLVFQTRSNSKRATSPTKASTTIALPIVDVQTSNLSTKQEITSSKSERNVFTTYYLKLGQT